MNEERTMILEMLKNGDITVEEAERLMDAIPRESDSLTVKASGAQGLAPKRIVVLVTEDDKAKVNVKVPFSLVRAGLKIGKAFGGFSARNADSEAEARAFEMLQELDIDEILASISDGEIELPYTMVDVDNIEDGKVQHVKVTLE
ncbi:MAG: hypothetical protein LBV27_02030 [Oscillospiraceae bacterium]|jgi:2,3-bisphosphoglycerate-independent phosphoglycerate mutase|nr:hypothetical protein [Oscillospiraceae bacterium]